MADNTIANAIKFLKGEEKSLPAAKTEGQVYFAYKNVGTAEKPSYTGAIYIDTPIGGTQNRIKMTANADIADKAFNDSAGLNIRDTYLSGLGYTDDGKQTILIKGSGNNQTRIALPIASTTKSGIVTTDTQSFGGTKTFTTINSTNLTITGTSGFNYSGIGAGVADVARPVWFADSSGNGKPVINTNFTYNPATQTLSVANLSGTADKANKDNAGNDIRNTYINNITVNGTTLTFTKGSGATSSITLQDNNNAVTQTAIKSSDYTNWRTVLWGASNSATEGFAPTTVTDGTFTSDTLTFQPSSGTLKAKVFKGSLLGNATTATTTTKLQTYKQGSTTETYGTQYPLYAQWEDSSNLRLKVDNYTVEVNYADKAGSASSATNAATATKLQTARTITLSGAVTGSVSFDGSANVILTTSVNHTHSQYYDTNISRTKNTVLAAPNGADGKAIFRSLVAADIPTLTKNKISDFPTSMPASDVYAWAKASTKPTYTKAEIGLGNVDNTADSQKSVKYATTSGSATTTTKLQTYKQGSTTETYGTQYPLYAQWEDNSNLRLKVDNYTVKVNYADKAGSASNATTAKNVSATEGTADVARHVWFSDGGAETQRCYTDSLKYNPVSNSMTVNITGSAATADSANYVVGSYTGNGGQQNPNYFGLNKVGFLMMDTTVNGNSSYKDWLIMDCYGGGDVGGGVAFGVNRQKLGAYIMRSDASRKAWAESAELLHTANYTEYTVTKSGSGASGTWGINVTGSAGSVTWGNVSGKPSSFNPSSHTHPYLPLSGGTMTGTINFTATKLACNFRPNSSAYCTGIMHQTNGNEALVFAAANAVTSFIFKCGLDPIGMTANTWTGITPSMQIKNQSVYINSLIGNNVTPAYNLYVNGSTCCHGTLGVGNGSGSAEIDFFPTSSSTIGARIKAYNDRIEFVFS